MANWKNSAKISLEKRKQNSSKPSMKTPQLSPPRESFLTPIVQKARLLNGLDFLEIIPKIPHILLRFCIFWMNQFVLLYEHSSLFNIIVVDSILNISRVWKRTSSFVKIKSPHYLFPDKAHTRRIINPK